MRLTPEQIQLLDEDAMKEDSPILKTIVGAFHFDAAFDISTKKGVYPTGLIQLAYEQSHLWLSNFSNLANFFVAAKPTLRENITLYILCQTN